MSTTRLLFLLLSLAAGASAQAPDGSAPPFDLRQAHGVCSDDAGVPWAVGHDYKARFADGAMEFVPALGPTASRNLPLVFRLQSIACGTALLHDAAAGPAPTATIHDRQIAFVRSPVVERYDATPAGVEQSFLLRERPAGDGDLIVRGAITTELGAQRHTDGTWRFTDGRHGGVAIGAVTGIAADGARCRGSATFADGVLELRLPAAFVATATYPLVLDPLFGTVLLPGSTGWDDSEADAAYEATAGVYLVAWRRSTSATDQDLRAQRITTDGTFVGSLISITNTATSEIRPAVATLNQPNRFVVAWQSATSPFGPWSVLARSIAADTGALGTTVTVASSGIDPAVCGDRDTTSSQATIAWHAQGVGIRARTASVDAAGTITLGNVATLQSAGNVHSGPSIGKSNTPGRVTVVTWETTQTSGNSLFALAVDHAATAVGPVLPIVLDAAGTIDHAVDGDGQQFFVAMRSGSLHCARLVWNGASLALVVSTTVPGSTDARLPAVGWLGDRCLVAWQHPTANPFDSQVQARVFAPDCTICSQPITVPTASTPNQQAPAIATHYAAANLQLDALLAWNETTSTAPFVGNVGAQRFTRMVGAPPTVLGPGCGGGGGTAGTNGPFALGNTQFRFTLTGADPTATWAILTMNTGEPPVVCGCTFTQPVVTFVVPPVGGNADFLFAVPCKASLLAIQLEYQWLSWGVAASPCPLVPNLVSSDRVLLTLTE